MGIRNNHRCVSVWFGCFEFFEFEVVVAVLRALLPVSRRFARGGGPAALLDSAKFPNADLAQRREEDDASFPFLLAWFFPSSSLSLSLSSTRLTLTLT